MGGEERGRAELAARNPMDTLPLDFEKNKSPEAEKMPKAKRLRARKLVIKATGTRQEKPPPALLKAPPGRSPVPMKVLEPAPAGRSESTAAELLTVPEALVSVTVKVPALSAPVAPESFRVAVLAPDTMLPSAWVPFPSATPLRNHWKVGAGSPGVVTEKVAVPPALIVWDWGWVTMPIQVRLS